MRFSHAGDPLLMRFSALLLSFSAFSHSVGVFKSLVMLRLGEELCSRKTKDLQPKISLLIF